MRINKKIAFLPRHESSWVEMLPLITHFKENSELEPFVIISTNASKSAEIFCIDNNISYINVLDRLISLNSSVGKGMLWHETCNKSKVYKTPYLIIDWLLNNLVLGLVSSCIFYRIYLKTFLYLKKIFIEEAIDVLVLPGDRELGPVLPAIRAAKECCIKSVVLNLSWPHPDNLVRPREKELKFRLNRLPPVLNIFISYFWKKQVFQKDNVRLLFSPGWVVLALYLLKMVPKNPWLQGASNSDYIIVDSKETMKILTNNNVPYDKVKLLGAVDTDALYKSYSQKDIIKNECREKYFSGSCRKIAIFALPLFYETAMTDLESQVNEVEYIVDMLVKKKFDVLISPHPKCNLNIYTGTFNKKHVSVMKERLNYYIPVGDVFVCGNSLTVKWAWLCLCKLFIL